MPTLIVIAVIIALAVYWYNRRTMRLLQPIQPQPPIEENDEVYEYEIKGESNYQQSLIRLFGQYTKDGTDTCCSAMLTREPSNPHDKNAVRCDISGLVVGYLAKDDAADISTALKKMKENSIAVNAQVRGGWVRSATDKGMYGVSVEIPARLAD